MNDEARSRGRAGALMVVGCWSGPRNNHANRQPVGVAREDRDSNAVEQPCPTAGKRLQWKAGCQESPHLETFAPRPCDNRRPIARPQGFALIHFRAAIYTAADDSCSAPYGSILSLRYLIRLGQATVWVRLMVNRTRRTVFRIHRCSQLRNRRPASQSHGCAVHACSASKNHR